MAKKKQDQADSPYNDVTDAEPDEVAAEQALRASGQNNGGGPWPSDLLLERYVNRGQSTRRA
jgi:hypothetical protein